MNPRDAERLDLHFPVLEVSGFVDSETVVLTGFKIDSIKSGDELFILGIGTVTIPNTDVPLILPKRTLDVTVAAGLYALAKGKYIIQTVQTGLQMFENALKPRETKVRPDLTSNEAVFLGNPGRAPLQTGDIVIRVNDLKDYISVVASEREKIKF